jgi:hypothetical protein
MDRTEILSKLANGTITAEDAAHLLRGRQGHQGNPPTGGAPSPAAARPATGNRQLHIRVSNLETGRDRVNVNLPLTLVDAALKLGARFEPQIGNVNANEIFEMIESGVQGRLVDVENYEDGERVEIFID